MADALREARSEHAMRRVVRAYVADDAAHHLYETIVRTIDVERRPGSYLLIDRVFTPEDLVSRTGMRPATVRRALVAMRSAGVLTSATHCGEEATCVVYTYNSQDAVERVYARMRRMRATAIARPRNPWACGACSTALADTMVVPNAETGEVECGVCSSPDIIEAPADPGVSEADLDTDPAYLAVITARGFQAADAVMEREMDEAVRAPPVEEVAEDDEDEWEDVIVA